MERTRRQTALTEQVRLAMVKRRKATAGRVPAVGGRPRATSEQMARWENEGGSLGRRAARRPRPLP